MLLQELQKFEWLNEPLGVFFINDGMKIVAGTSTNFYQNEKLHINKDDGHFFFNEIENDFKLVVKWNLEARPSSAQSGIMLRIDSKNWASCSLVYTKEGKNKLCTTITNLGYPDHSFQELKYDNTDIWYKLERDQDHYYLYFSRDNDKYHLIRKFTLIKDTPKIKIGAYICSPENTEFEAVLSYINIDIS